MAKMPPMPFEAQADCASSRTCGTAALCMVYRSFGLPCSQHEIWEALRGQVTPEPECAPTYLLARDALERGLAALVVQARAPWTILQRCHEQACRVILNHRLTLAAAGHFSVLAGIDEVEALLHDPLLGPSQRRPRTELLQLWQAPWGRSEIAGQVLVAFAENDPSAASCSLCGVALLASVQCVNCRATIGLRPSAALGCGLAACAGRLWKRIFCPYCDAGHASLIENEPTLACGRIAPHPKDPPAGHEAVGGFEQV